ncbi:MAG: hypothetical protein Q4P24_12540, partial [Rhodobacterales bacterium]|nr:hypothetical protein [Rhodobacterales bacterium]
VKHVLETAPRADVFSSLLATVRFAFRFVLGLSEHIIALMTVGFTIERCLSSSSTRCAMGIPFPVTAPISSSCW